MGDKRQTLQVRIPRKQNRVPRIYHRTRRGQDRPSQNRGHLGLDDPQKNQGNTMLPRVLQLLQAIYRRLQQESQTAIRQNKEGIHRQLGIRRQTTTSIRQIKDKTHQSTGTDLLPPSGTTQDGNRRLKIRLLWSTVTTMPGWKMEATGIPIQDNVGRRMQV